MPIAARTNRLRILSSEPPKRSVAFDRESIWKPGVSVRSLAKKVLAQAFAHGFFDLAAQMSFYFVMSLFPFFMIIAALVGLLPSTTLWQHFAQWVTDYLPAQSRRVVFETILGLSRGSAGFLSFGILATLWTASSGFSSLMESLSVARGTHD